MAVDEVVAERITIPPSVAVATDTSLYTREARRLRRLNGCLQPTERCGIIKQMNRI